MPLLMGISGQDLARIEERLNIQVESVHASRFPIIRQGEICSQLFFLVTGEMQKEKQSADGLYVISEHIKGPTVIEAENLYGLHCLYEHTYTPLTDCKTICISKNDVRTHLMKSEIFRINYMNMLSAQIYRLKHQAAYAHLKNAEEKIITFILRNFSTTDSEKMLQIKMTDLADYLDETRLSVSQALNKMEKSGLISLRRKEIYIHDIQRIIEYRNEQDR